MAADTETMLWPLTSRKKAWLEFSWRRLLVERQRHGKMRRRGGQKRKDRKREYKKRKKGIGKERKGKKIGYRK